MRAHALQALADDLARDRRITADEALTIRKEVFPDGIVSREEAEMLVALDARVSNSDPEWTAVFIEAISDHVLQADVPWLVDETEAAWLVANLGASEIHVETLLKILERCESAPPSLYAYARGCVAKLCTAKPIGVVEVARIQRALYAGNFSVSEAEARWLVDIDAESDGRANDPAWTDLFVKAQLCHLMGRQHPEQLDEDAMRKRQQWLTDTSFKPLRLLGEIFSGRAFSGGWKQYSDSVRTAPLADRWETHYEAANLNAEEDAELTAEERARTLQLANADGKVTANERALLAELEKLESAA